MFVTLLKVPQWNQVTIRLTWTNDDGIFWSVLAAKSLGDAAYNNFLDHTFLGDRKTTIREYFLTTGSGIMEEEPPEPLKTRYGGWRWQVTAWFHLGCEIAQKWSMLKIGRRIGWETRRSKLHSCKIQTTFLLNFFFFHSLHQVGEMYLLIQQVKHFDFAASVSLVAAANNIFTPFPLVVAVFEVIEMHVQIQCTQLAPLDWLNLILGIQKNAMEKTDLTSVFLFLLKF